MPAAPIECCLSLTSLAKTDPLWLSQNPPSQAKQLNCTCKYGLQSTSTSSDQLLHRHSHPAHPGAINILQLARCAVSYLFSVQQCSSAEEGGDAWQELGCIGSRLCLPSLPAAAPLSVCGPLLSSPHQKLRIKKSINCFYTSCSQF